MELATTSQNHLLLRALMNARALISDPTHWCQKAYARDKNDIPTSSLDENANSFCAMSAIIRASAPNTVTVGSRAIKLLNEEIVRNYKEYEGIIRFNDEHAHEEVLDVFDTALDTLYAAA